MALHPYPANLVIATKVGLTRPGPNAMVPLGRPEYLRQQVELSLQHLSLERIDLLQLHRIDPKVPLSDQIGGLVRMQEEGKIRHIGLSQVTVEELREASRIGRIVSVQNLFNLVRRDAEVLVDFTVRNDIAFIPFWPLVSGGLTREGNPIENLAKNLSFTSAQIAIAWLLMRSPNILPIPGTSNVKHLEENVRTASVRLYEEDFAALDAMGQTST